MVAIWSLYDANYNKNIFLNTPSEVFEQLDFLLHKHVYITRKEVQDFIDIVTLT